MFNFKKKLLEKENKQSLLSKKKTNRFIILKKKLHCLRKIEYTNKKYFLNCVLYNSTKVHTVKKLKQDAVIKYKKLLLGNLQRKGKLHIARKIYGLASKYILKKYKIGVNKLLILNMYNLLQYLSLIKILKKDSRVEWVPTILPEQLRIKKAIRTIYNTICLVKKKQNYLLTSIIISILQHSIDTNNKQNNGLLKLAKQNKYRFLNKFKKKKSYYRVINRVKILNE